MIHDTSQCIIHCSFRNVCSHSAPVYFHGDCPGSLSVVLTPPPPKTTVHGAEILKPTTSFMLFLSLNGFRQCADRCDLYIYKYIYTYMYLYIYVSIFPYIYPSIYLYLSVCLSVCLCWLLVLVLQCFTLTWVGVNFHLQYTAVPKARVRSL